MNHRLSVIMVTLNAEELLQRCITSFRPIVDEVIIIDAGSVDRTSSILEQNSISFTKVKLNHLGKNKAKALIFLGASYTIAATPVYKQHLLDDNSAVKRRIIRDSVLLFCLGIFIAVVSWFVAPLVLPFALGKEFLDGVDVFRVVIFALPFLLVSAVCMNVLYLMGKVHWVVMIFILQIVLNVLGNVIFVPLFSYHASAIITVLCEVLNAALTVPLVFIAYENFSRRRSPLQS